MMNSGAPGPHRIKHPWLLEKYHKTLIANASQSRQSTDGKDSSTIERLVGVSITATRSSQINSKQPISTMAPKISYKRRRNTSKYRQTTETGFAFNTKPICSPKGVPVTSKHPLGMRWTTVYPAKFLVRLSMVSIKRHSS